MEQSTEKTKKAPANRKSSGSLYCRPEKRGLPRLGKTSGRYCPTCRFKIRGANHEQGTHHNSRV